MANGTCSIPDCPGPVAGRGWCSKHWQKWRKYGDPLAVGARTAQVCSVIEDGVPCERPCAGRGWCSKHWQVWRKHGDPLGSTWITGDDEARFWQKVNKDGPIPAKRPDLGACWQWTGCTDDTGYGRFSIGHLEVRAARYICGLKVALIPDGSEPDHLCKNTGCVNYESHIEIVPQRVNILRSDGPAAINARKTHCDQGHEFTAANTRVTVKPDGSVRRSCRPCGLDADRRYREKVRARKLATERVA